MSAHGNVDTYLVNDELSLFEVDRDRHSTRAVNFFVLLIPRSGTTLGSPLSPRIHMHGDPTRPTALGSPLTPKVMLGSSFLFSPF